MIWPGHPERPRPPVGERVLELVGPARVVEEVRGRERQVDVARLLDRLAAVERLGHRELPRPLLQDAGDPEQVLGPLGRPQARPAVVEGGPGRPHREVDVLGARLGHLGQRLLVGGRAGREPCAGARLDHLAADVEAVALLEADDVASLRRGGVLPVRHGRKRARRLFEVGHQSSGEVVGGLVDAGLLLADLHEDVVQERRGAEPEPLGCQPLAAERLVQDAQVLDRELGVADPAGRLHPHPAAGLGLDVADRLEHAQGHGQGRGRADLAGGGLDEVGARGHRQERGAADVVVGAELTGLEDHLEVRGRRGLLHPHDLVVHLGVAARQERSPVDHHVDLVGAELDRRPHVGQLDLDRRLARREGGRDRGDANAAASPSRSRATATRFG